ncbi:MAG: insulinase family protein [Prevotellaceae bacterium]|jgi:predicted Zn-dependent peptidase|nr:insulinase family protein [Prevotellaceae bacterium]
MKRRLILLSLAFLFGFAANGQSQTKVEYTEYDLDNGLHVILHQDRSSPNVMVSIMYHVGAKNEDPSKTGFAHFFEHLMFEGSENIGRGEYMKMIQANGGTLNANTSQDRTYYFEMMPTNQLELALWMESERMFHAKIDTIGVNTQKGVVIEERKQSYDNRPYGTWMEKMGELAFTVHPYRWQTIGYPEHIKDATFDDINNFYKTYYVPNNAVLVVVGDFEEKQTKEWIQKYFGDIPKSTRPMFRPTVVEPLDKTEIREVVYDKIQMPALFMGYHSPAMDTKDAYALEILCNILQGGKSSRFKTNITDKGIALETVIFPFTQEHPGLTYVIGFANAGGKLEDVESALDAEIEKVRNELVSEEEFQMAMAAKEFEVANSLISLPSKAQTFANNYTYFKDASRINKILDDYTSLTRENIRNVAKKYLTKNNRVVLYYLPESAKQ